MKNRLVILILGINYIFSGLSAQTISLKGKWRFATDPMDKGIIQKWNQQILPDSIQLPGSMLQNGKGEKLTLQTKWTGSIYDSSWYLNPRYAKYRQPDNLKFPFWLTPEKYYVGAAWYQKQVNIPQSFINKTIQLFLERCHTETTIWIDDKKIGMQNSMVAPHLYDLTAYLTKGKHTITIRIDNRIKEINVGPDSHSLTDHTQGNWNGVVGRLELQVSAATRMNQIQVYPDIIAKKATLKIPVKGSLQQIDKIIVSAKSYNSKTPQIVKPKEFIFLANAIKDTISVDYPMGDHPQLWSEFDPALYRLTVKLLNKNGTTDLQEISFGMRSFKTAGKQFSINGQTTFLRGTVENCVFPLTGYAPMDEANWERVFRICKRYGLNHMRFHSFCPPEAAFSAADKVGFYLQPEGPSWANHGSSLGDRKPIDTFIYDETRRMEQFYGNHPSYCMLAYGNEPRGGRQVEYLTGFIKYWQAKDSRRVYTGASVAMSWPLVPANEFMIKSGARNLSWNQMPENKFDYTAAIENFSMPYVAHEMGQWCVFPDFKEIKKYTGVYKAKNFELFQEDLKDAGMLDEAEQFLQSTGKLQVLCYKHEIEKSMRTPLNGGFQLLSLNDYSGQGTALVGLLNAFWEEKGYCNASSFSRFCNSTVPLIRTEKFQYLRSENIQAAVEIYHYGQNNINHAIVYWRLKDQSGKIIQSGSFAPINIQTGKNSAIGNIQLKLENNSKAEQLNLEVGIKNTDYLNDWNFWVYPDQIKTKPTDIYYTTEMNAATEAVLQKGGKVFLNLAGKIMKGKEVSQAFLPVFWNTSWFKMRPPHTMGISINSQHPAFANFPTANHSDIQWWEILNKTQVMHLEDFPKSFKPLIRPVDTWFMNRRLALVFEAKVGNGKIVVSSADLNDTSGKRPAARQLYHSIISYMNSEAFEPQVPVNLQWIKALTKEPSRYTFDAYTKDSPDELKPKIAITN